MEKNYNTVLLIDDDDIDNIIHKMVINEVNFAENIITCKTSEDAIIYLQQAKRGEKKIPDLILLDIIMPVEDGFVFLDEYEKLPDSIKNNIKIIVITHSIDDRDKIKSQNNKYVTHFIDKPLTVEKLELLSEAIL